jgi:PAS domain S-box-containing protein
MSDPRDTQQERTEVLLEAIRKAQTDFIVDADRRAVFDHLLTTLLDVTESEYGFIAELLTRADGEPYLKSRAITNIAWDETTRRFFDENAAAGLEFYNPRSLFGAVITTGKAVIANSPSTDARRGGLPPGHPPLRAFLGLPLYRSDKMIGVIGVANRPGGYDEAMGAFLAPLLATCTNLIEASRIDADRRATEDQMRALLENAPGFIVIVDREGVILSYNRAFAADMPAQARGKSVFDLISPDHAETLRGVLAEVFTSGRPGSYEAANRGKTSWYMVNAGPLQRDGQVTGAVLFVLDVTERKRLELEERRRTEEVLRLQREAMAALSTPILTVWDGVLAMPIVGVVDQARASQMLERLLREIGQARARYAILDLTGVETVDASTAGHLLGIARAASLLGSRCLISGISPAVAQEMALHGHGGADLAAFGTLKDALRHAVAQSAAGPRRPG